MTSPNFISIRRWKKMHTDRTGIMTFQPLRYCLALKRAAGGARAKFVYKKNQDRPKKILKSNDWILRKLSILKVFHHKIQKREMVCILWGGDTKSAILLWQERFACFIEMDRQFDIKLPLGSITGSSIKARVMGQIWPWGTLIDSQAWTVRNNNARVKCELIFQKCKKKLFTIHVIF